MSKGIFFGTNVRERVSMRSLMSVYGKFGTMNHFITIFEQTEHGFVKLNAASVKLFSTPPNPSHHGARPATANSSPL